MLRGERIKTLYDIPPLAKAGEVGYVLDIDDLMEQVMILLPGERLEVDAVPDSLKFPVASEQLLPESAAVDLSPVLLDRRLWFSMEGVCYADP